jgi:hypothetical protein
VLGGTNQEKVLNIFSNSPLCTGRFAILKRRRPAIDARSSNKSRYDNEFIALALRYDF